MPSGHAPLPADPKAPVRAVPAKATLSVSHELILLYSHLGLSIAARIVEKHGGALEFETREGRGTTFRVVLPIDQAT